LGRTVFVSVVAQGEDCALDATDEPGCFLVALAGAVGDVARCDDNLPGRRGRRRSRRSLRSAAKVRRTATKATMTTVAVLPASMFDASERLTGSQKEHSLPFLICVTDAGHTDPSEGLLFKLFTSCNMELMRTIVNKGRKS
jgi:hypothetical protein